jgi:phosphoribosylanthranilate isomerase
MDGLPFHELGFVFAPSKRRVTREEAKGLLEAAKRISAAADLPPRAVGVFVDMPLGEMEPLLSEVPLDVVQLHGSESPDYCRTLKNSNPSTAIWRVMSVGPNRSSGAELDREALEQLSAYAESIDAVLIDAPGGGTGQPFDWQAIDSYQTAARQLGLTLYVAGGLHEGNVGELLRLHAPQGVDVSSGVETDGRKDIDKIKAFVRKVTEA